VKSPYTQIWKMEIEAKSVDGVSSMNLQPDPLDYAPEKKSVITYKRHIFPRDYARKKEMADTVLHDVGRNLVEHSHDFLSIKELPHYYFQAKKIRNSTGSTVGRGITKYKNNQTRRTSKKGESRQNR